MSSKKAMVLAAGLGTRLRPLTDLISKPMAPIVNRPVMEHIIKLLAKHGFKDIVCNLHYFPDEIKNHFRDGSKWGVNIVYSFEEELLGTAGGVKKVEDFFQPANVHKRTRTHQNRNWALKFSHRRSHGRCK